MIKVFTPSFADESGTNAQNLTAKEVVARLDPRKFHVTLLNEEAPDPRILSRTNTTILQWRARGNTLQVLWHLSRNTPDIYFFPREGPLDAAFLHLRRWLRWRTALVTYVVSGGELENGKPRPTLARNIREADGVAGNSEHMTALLRDRVGVHATTIHDGIDRRFFYPSGSPGKRDATLAVLFAGSMRPYKRPAMVVQQALRWPGVQFRLAGHGEELENCRKLLANRKCTNVEFLGHLSSQQLGEEMRRADVFFFPSILEGHPQVLGQAAASGLPVVAMNLYRPDFVVDGETGFLAASDEELGQKLDVLLTQHDLRKSMAQAAIRHVQQFDWDTVTARWQQIFEKVMEARQKR